jgi:lysophospholipase L1-like esterase
MLGDNYQVINYGASGRTLQDEGDTPYRKTGFIDHSQSIAPDIVVIMLGTNDSKSYNWDTGRFEEQYIRLIQSYQSLEEHPEIYITAPPAAFVLAGKDTVVYDIDNSIIEKEIHEIVRNVAEQTGAVFIDMFEATKEHPEYFMDGVHGNQNGYNVIEGTVYSALGK